MRISRYRKIIIGNTARLICKDNQDLDIGWFVNDRIYFIKDIKNHNIKTNLLNKEFYRLVKKKQKRFIYSVLIKKKNLNFDVIFSILRFI